MLHIRPATADDWRGVRYCDIHCFGDVYPDENYVEVLSQGYSVVLVNDRDRILGAGLINGYVDTDTDNIISLCVLKKYRQFGYGDQMLKYAVCTLKTFGVEHVSLHVRVSNLTAQRLYIRNEFKILFTTESYYKDGEASLVMIC